MEKIPTLHWAVAAVVHRLRRRAGLSQGQLAGLAGLSEDYISGMERGIQCGSLTAIVHIASALRMEAVELVRLIEAEMGAGPHPPGRGAGKPPKREKK
ncbi:helix-turn-helix transcriptional regulator [Desulfovibrio sp. PG-178-WT-4]|uniref:Helix-turn-helix transcriptional regulator n=1 Tax=Desulfovibrio porci TaxID=2605782 RepID=A0A6L5XMV3_9BACT|nr:helix-turn-helix transcriptional regulator [Desulfovibrio porci]MSS28486.1 helix-turn-helix transcriptional regulator [Desulfovibrio porci]